MNIETAIFELLIKTDCVVVPNFGAFIGRYQPAYINWSNQSIEPPYRSLLFNPNIISNDGVLTHHISKVFNCSYEQALEKIEDQVREWKSKISAGERIAISKVGFLFSQNDKISFQQDRFFNFLQDAHGLKIQKFLEKRTQTFDLPKASPVIKDVVKQEFKKETIVETPKPIYTPAPKKSEPVVKVEKEKVTAPIAKTPVVKLNVEETIEEVVVENNTEEATPKVPKGKIIQLRKKLMRYSAVAAVGSFLFYAYWIPVHTDFLKTKQLQMSDLNPMAQSKRTFYEPRHSILGTDSISFERDQLLNKIEMLPEQVSVYNYAFAEDFIIPVSTNSDFQNTVLESEVETPTESSSNKVAEVNTIVESNLNYHLIGGCFSEKANANNFVKSIGGNAHIVDHNKGLYRVSIGSYASRKEAKSQQKTFKQNDQSSWILKSN